MRVDGCAGVEHQDQYCTYLGSARLVTMHDELNDVQHVQSMSNSGRHMTMPIGSYCRDLATLSTTIRFDRLERLRAILSSARYRSVSAARLAVSWIPAVKDMLTIDQVPISLAPGQSCL